jgi:membrane-bound lytic murein transglycosylase D
MRAIFESRNLPPDLAYMALAESGLENGGVSSAGAAGVWQFTAGTARAYGLKVGGGVDERLSPVKSTYAAARYIRELILEFGAGSSVMLAMAAYNVGPSSVKGAIHRLVNDPIQQRNFWYLYRRGALPAETREYVPKVIAAMIIGRNPERFGF